MANILIVDDLRSMRLTLGGVLEDERHNRVIGIVDNIVREKV